MPTLRYAFKKALYRVLYMLVSVVLVVAYLNVVMSVAGHADSPAPAWGAPNVMALEHVSDGSSAQKEPHFFENLDCMPIMYRLVASQTLQTGCFTETAFGMMDVDTHTVIFDGTDEGLPLLPYQLGQTLVPWPHAGNLIALTPDAVDGSYVTLYKGITASLEDHRDTIGQLVSKQLTTGADITLQRPDGRRLLANPQSLAFSAGGAWLVAETLQGSFVRVNLSSLDMTAFAKAYGSQGSPGLLAARIAVSYDGRFVAIYSQAANEFKVYDLDSCGAQTVDLAPQGCRAFDYQPFIEQRLGKVQAIRHVRFAADGLLSFSVTASDNSKSGIYELAPAPSIGFFTEYLGLGDSFTSGEGAFDYLNGTDTADNTCHLAQSSYPLLLTRDLFGRAGGHSVACSGAVIHDIGNLADSYQGQARDRRPAESVLANYLPGYVAQGRFVAQSRPRVVTVSIGGNDIGFGDIVAGCVMPHFGNNTCYNSYEDRLELKNLIDRTKPRWVGLYRQLAAAAPGTQIYGIGYPDVVSDTGSCGLNVHLSQPERSFARELVAYLNSAIASSAAEADISYVDISRALIGHRLCEASAGGVAVNGLTAGKDFGFLGLELLGRESYHPNALGHSLIEQTILNSTHNLQKPAAASNSANSSAALLNAPVTGRPIMNKSFQTMTQPLLGKGTSTTVTATGLRPATAYSLHVDGLAGTTIGSGQSDAQGNISITVNVPTNANPGGHTLDIIGPGQTDTPLDVSQPVYISEAPGDSDGDGEVDSRDSCPLQANSRQDNDQDGVDDVCDGLISQSMQGSGPPAITGSGAADTSTNHRSAGQPAISLATANTKPAQLAAKNPREQSEPAQSLTTSHTIPWRKLLLLAGSSWLLITVALLLYEKRAHTRVYTPEMDSG